MNCDEFKKVIVRTPDEEVLTAVLTINTNIAESKVQKIKTDLEFWAKTEGLKFNPLPSFPNFIIQTTAQHWREILDVQNDILTNKNLTLEVNNDVSFIPFK